ncbi:MAG: nitrile hydratase subunit alpha, partial [Candidatus Nanopelagicales bacterium]
MDFNELQLKAATDADFRARLLADPAATLAAEGVEVPEGVGVRIVESTAEEILLSIPPVLPEGTEI